MLDLSVGAGLAWCILYGIESTTYMARALPGVFYIVLKTPIVGNICRVLHLSNFCLLLKDVIYIAISYLQSASLGCEV